MENRRQQATRRLRCLLVLAGGYLKFPFVRRRRLMHKVARKALALIHHHHGDRRNLWPRALTEHEFSCADSPGPAFLAAKRILLRSRRRLRSGGGAATAGAPSSCCFGGYFRRPPSPYGRSRVTMAAEEDEAEAVETTDVDEGEEEDRAVLADDDDEDGWPRCGELLDVDDRAEEFINMFYEQEQLRAQMSFGAAFQGSP